MSMKKIKTFDDFIKEINRIVEESKYTQLSLFDKDNEQQRDMQSLRTEKDRNMQRM